MKHPVGFIALGLIALLALTSCNVFQVGVETATPAPTNTQVPTSSPVASATAPPPTAAATASPAPATLPAPTATPTREDEVILLLEPGLVSSVTSPVHVAGESEPTFEQNLVIQITDADGNVLAMQPTTIMTEAGTRGPFAVDVAFSVASDQPGRISVFNASARDGGLLHLASVEVTLLAGGAASINPAPPGMHPEIHALFAPAFLVNVSGGSVHVEGYSEYVFESTLSVVLCGEGGSGAPHFICGTDDNILAAGIAMVASPDIGQPGLFQADIAYSVAGPMHARVVVYSASARDGGVLHLSSREIMVAP